MIVKNQYLLLVLLLSTVLIKSISSIFYIEDIDSLRFALSIYDKFDLSKLQPHFPGYPIFCFSAKIIYSLIGSLAHTFSIIGAVSTFFIIYFSLLIVDSKDNLMDDLFVVSIILFNPMIYLLGNRYMPDLMGLSIAIVSFYYITEEDRNKILFGMFLAAVLCGVRLSYFPFIIIPIFISISHLSKKDKFLSGIYFLIGCTVWLLPMILITGLDELFYVALNQSSGHFIEYGGTFITESNWLSRFKFLIHTFWADGLGAYWPGRSPITFIISIFTLLTLIPIYRFSVDSFKSNNRIKILLISALLYIFWIIMFQNVIYKSRHVLPLVFVFILLIPLSRNYLFKNKMILNLFYTFFIISLGILSFNLSLQHKNPTAISSTKEYFAINKEDFHIVSTPLINFYLKSLGLDGKYYSVEDTVAIEQLSKSLDFKHVFIVGDFRDIFNNESEFNLDTVFYHNPYVNRMWSSIKIYSN